MATRKRKQAKPAPRKAAAKTKAKAAPSRAKAAKSKSKAAAPKSKAAAPKSKAAAPKSKAAAPKSKAAAPKVSASSAKVQRTVIRRDRGLEAEIAIAVVRGTTIADDREWVHQDYHVDLPRRHMDMPPWPHADFLFEEHVDTKTPHHDSNRSPEPKPPRKEGPHTDIERGHVDYGPYHTDIKKGDHSDFMGMPHWDYWAEKDDYHVDSFVGHQDEGTKEPRHDDLT